MKLLAVDTSGPVCGAAVLDGEKVLGERISQNRNTHSASLMPMIEDCLESAGTALSEMDALAVTVGPGSFTGVRIGVATVKGLAHGSGKPCIAVDALEALAVSTGVLESGALLCPIQDARAGQVYGACFREGRRLTENRALKLEDFLAEAEGLSPDFCLFTGDGVPAHEARIREILGDRARFAAAPFRFLRPAAVGWLAMTRGTAQDYRTLRESYLRPPNAEKNKKLLEAMRHE